MDKKLTIGSAVFDDFEGVYFTYQALRLANLDRLEDLDFIIVDNNPTSPEGLATKSFCEKAKVRYFAAPTPRTTAIRDRVFREALAPFTVCLDPHVLLEPQTVGRLLTLAENENQDPKSADLFHGPMLYDYLEPDNVPATHMDPRWRDNMFGTWGHLEKGKDPEGEPFEIPMHGLGLFACRTEAWPGFSPLFKGFGGEEGYIHEKFKQAGGKTWCLPWLRWVHRFDRPRGNVYPLHIEERIRNYAFGWLELGKDLAEVREHFEELHRGVPVVRIVQDAEVLFSEYLLHPEEVLEKLHAEPKPETVEEMPGQTPAPGPLVGKETWHQTTVNLGAPISFEVLGREFRVKSFGLEWGAS
jgi:hypothetical protein